MENQGFEPDVISERTLPEWFSSAMTSCPVMGVFRGATPAETVELANRAWDIGILQVEVPIESPGAVSALRAAVSAGADRGMKVGAGTIITLEQLDIAIDEGAAYAVSPGLDPQLILRADLARLPLVPGVATASEILRARRLGFEWMKAFPASVLGAAWFSAMTGPFPDIKLVATGGMRGSTAAEYLRAGASVIGVGSAIRDTGEADSLRELIARAAEEQPAP